MTFAIRVKPGTRVDLGSIDPSDNGGLTKKSGKKRMEQLAQQIDDLQDTLYAAGQHGVLVVLQGMDTSGKDGTIRNVFRYIDPLGAKSWAFKVPTDLELRHDFLWRIHDKVPERGMVTIFNRSHYEDVLVVRVNNLAPVDVWRSRYEHINAFERLLAESNTIVLKFFLHVSPEEQRLRLLAREADVEKSWKLSVSDWAQRQSWSAYMEAYEDVLSKCSTKHAPWQIVPADRKWFRNLAVAEAIVNALKPLKVGWIESLTSLGVERRKELEEYRARGGES
ncbi:polyphosphate kinase 2 family protein [soil metagenome]